MMVGRIARRSFLVGAGGLSAATAMAMAGCSSSSTAPSGDSGITLSWWDHYGPLQDLRHKTDRAFEDSPGGVPVKYQYIQTQKFGQALQLAHQSGQMPDIHSNAGLDIPLAQLISSGWLQPMDLGSALDRFPDGTIVDGVTRFDHKVYSFPVFSFRQYCAPVWFNTDMVKRADLDPDAPPTTYDEFRAACKAIKNKAGVAPWIWNLAQPGRLQEEVGDMAQAAGFEGDGRAGLEFRTGEYHYDSDAHLAVLEFLLSLKTDGYLAPVSSTLTPKTASVRWAAGAAAVFFDGPWRAGGVRTDSPSFLPKLGVGPMLVPEDGKQVVSYKGPSGGFVYLDAECEHPDKACELLKLCTKDEFFVGLAEAMDQPPLFLDAVKKATKVSPAYRKLLGMFEKQCFLAPVPIIANSDIGAVEAKQVSVQPDLGTIVQGLFSGQVRDAKAALKKLSDATTQAREKAIAAAKKSNKDLSVTLDDWKFSNWQPYADYTTTMYDGR